MSLSKRVAFILGTLALAGTPTAIIALTNGQAPAVEAASTCQTTTTTATTSTVSSSTTTVSLGTWDGLSAANPLPGEESFFPATSFWNQRVPANPTVLPNSAAMVRYILSKRNGPNTFVPTNEWGHPWVYASSSDPLVEVHLTEPWGSNRLNGMKVLIPAAARHTTGSDGQLAIIQPNGQEVDLWQMGTVSGGKVSASWGSIDAGMNGTGAESAATAAGFDLTAGGIRPEQLLSGQINNALFVVIGNSAPGFVYPATHSDGTDGSAPFHEGQRFYLDYTDAEIAVLPIKPYLKTIVTALAHYGFYVGDKGGSGFDLVFESPIDRTAFGQPEPWGAVAKREGLSSTIFPLASGIDWSRLRAIPAP